MSRRCKSGQRARVIAEGSNKGKIVLVLQPYRGEKVAGSGWVEHVYPWVVAALGAPIAWEKDGRPEIVGASITAVLDDTELEPLSDDDDGLQVRWERAPQGEPQT